MDFCDSPTDESMTLNSSHNETMSKTFEEEPIDKNLHFHSELITERNNPTEETNSNEDTVAEKHLNDPEIENVDQGRQRNIQKTSLPDKKDAALIFIVDCPNLLNHD